MYAVKKIASRIYHIQW